MIKQLPHIFRLSFLLLFGLSQTEMSAQEVSLSPELSIRNYLSYELLGKVEDRYIVYRDKGFAKQINVFNEYLEQTSESELVLEQKRSTVIQAQNLDSLFQIVYSYVEEDSTHLRMRRYNSKGVLRDSALLIKKKRNATFKPYEYEVSEDQSKLLLYSMSKDGVMDCILFDNDQGEVIAQRELIIDEFQIRTQHYRMELSDRGELFFMFHKRFDGSDENLLKVATFDFMTFQSSFGVIDFGAYFRRDMITDYNNLHNKLIICGTYAEKRGRDPLGHYIINEDANNLGRAFEPSFVEFSPALVQEVGRSKRKKSKIFQNFWIKDILKRQDGGLLIFMELYKEFSRRSSYGSNIVRNSNFGPNARRGWVDYYNEDIVITSFSADETIDWTKVLYKKQFSQDDDAVFSSYFVMKTPSRLRLVYNDEIKRSNTVSEYIMDPGGWIKRNSLLSTSQLNMKLRFRDAVQISSNELLIPSENNYTLSLVKITY